MDFHSLEFEQWSKKVFIKEFGIKEQQADYVWGFIVSHFLYKKEIVTHPSPSPEAKLEELDEKEVFKFREQWQLDGKYRKAENSGKCPEHEFIKAIVQRFGKPRISKDDIKEYLKTQDIWVTIKEHYDVHLWESNINRLADAIIQHLEGKPKQGESK